MMMMMTMMMMMISFKETSNALVTLVTRNPHAIASIKPRDAAQPQ